MDTKKRAVLLRALETGSITAAAEFPCFVIPRMKADTGSS